MASHSPFNSCFSSFSPLCLVQKALLSGFHDSSSPECHATHIMTAEADQDNIFGGFGAVLGYVGGEAATVEWFERLLWPQRFFSGFRVASVPSVALLLPMGGPLHKAALNTLDNMFQHGLFKGAHRGHMLGTPFFRSLDWTYTMHGNAKHETHTEPLRNCLWARSIALLPVSDQLVSTGPRDEEKGPRPQTILRAHVAVNHLTLSAPSDKDRDRLPFVAEAADTPTLRVFLGIITAEATAILVALGQTLVFRTTWSFLFLVPLFIRLLSACLSLRREKLLSLSSEAAASDPALDFQVHCPQSDGSFMLLTGPPALVLQFVRHFGHPVRSRWRELAQMACVAAFGSFFPIGLMCSMVWMPLPVQCVWLSYQIYLVVAMHVARYTQSGLGATTEARIAEALTSKDARRGNANVDGEASILFGHERGGAGTVKATWSATYHRRNLEGAEAMKELLRRKRRVPMMMKSGQTALESAKEFTQASAGRESGFTRSDSTDSDITLHDGGASSSSGSSLHEKET